MHSENTQTIGVLENTRDLPKDAPSIEIGTRFVSRPMGQVHQVLWFDAHSVTFAINPETYVQEPNAVILVSRDPNTVNLTWHHVAELIGAGLLERV